MGKKNPPLRVQVKFIGGPRDGQVVEMETSAMSKKTSGPRYVLDPNRSGDYPLRYIWKEN